MEAELLVGVRVAAPEKGWGGGCFRFDGVVRRSSGGDTEIFGRMEMDEKIGVEADVEARPLVFEAYEVNAEYEFDASMFFDFTLPESQAVSRLAELWFQSARSYPPSPFVANLFLRESTQLETINSSQVLGKTGELSGGDDNLHTCPVSSVVDANNRECTEIYLSKLQMDFNYHALS